jgi:simple sugar transport system ATP-binding protein
VEGSPFAASAARAAPVAPLLEVRGLSKAFGHVEALRDVDLLVEAGTVVGVVGDNGAGKSTLVGCLSGVLYPDWGEILLDGEPIELSDPLDARLHGIETVYQDLALANDLEAALNIFLGRELKRSGFLGRLGFVDRRAMRKEAAATLHHLGIPLPGLSKPVSYLSGGQRQGVAIARAARWATRMIFMDEPTAALGVRQSAIVLDMIRRVRDRGIAVMLISHNLHDVFAVADRIVVLRLGEVVASVRRDETNPDEIVKAITGAALV